MWSGRSGKVCFGGKRLFETDVRVYSMYNNLLPSTYTPNIDHVDVYIATTVPRWPMIPLGAIQGCRYHVALL